MKEYEYDLIHKDAVNSYLRGKALIGWRVHTIHRNENARDVDILLERDAR